MSDLFALIRTRRQSGLLSVERYENGRFEEGEVSFQKGFPVNARSGSRTGQDALSYLHAWSQVDFSFTPETTETSNPLPASPIPPPPVMRPTNTTQPLSPPRQRTPPPHTDLPQPSSSQPANTRSAFYERTPRKLVNEQNVMNMALTRPQRSLYLLIDGRRTVADLIRFTNRDAQEVYQLLSELQARGLILV